jgi:hypothetical protein
MVELTSANSHIRSSLLPWYSFNNSRLPSSDIILITVNDPFGSMLAFILITVNDPSGSIAAL